MGGEEKVYCPPLKPGKEGFEVTLGGIAGVSEVWGTVTAFDAPQEKSNDKSQSRHVCLLWGRAKRERSIGSQLPIVDKNGENIHIFWDQIWTLKTGATMGLLKSLPHPERMMGSSRRESQEQPDSGGFVFIKLPITEETPGILYLP